MLISNAKIDLYKIFENNRNKNCKKDFCSKIFIRKRRRNICIDYYIIFFDGVTAVVVVIIGIITYLCKS